MTQELLEQVEAALLPCVALSALADLRGLPHVRTTLAGERAWVYWDAGDERVFQRIFPLPGVELFCRHDGLWFRAGNRLPSYDVPDKKAAHPLDRILFPSPTKPEKCEDVPVQPRRLDLVADGSVRATTAMTCELTELNRWADHATTHELESIRGAISGARVLLIGNRLPRLPGGTRFWGERVLVPLGFRIEPAVAEMDVLEALKVPGDPLVVLTRDGAELIAEEVLRPLSRAGIRLAIKETTKHAKNTKEEK